ncbi:MAG: CDP-alcohol phosphatidyltransferase family protein [Candidatus Aminicenantales bacterium]
MEALIIAAGKGKRFRECFSPKPLASIYGLSLIERIILTAKEAGITRFKIVVGYKADQVMRRIGSGDKYGVRIDYILNPEWEKGNGVSVYAARNAMKGRFLLLMSDHLFDDRILSRLEDMKPAGDDCILCVDRNLDGSPFNLKDATKALVEDGKVEKIGKHIPRFNAIDTGIFLCTPAIFQALEQSISRKEYALSAGTQILADRGALSVCDVSGLFWIDVDDREALQKAKEILVQQVLKMTDGPIARTLNRRISLWISTRLCQFNISPNWMTFLSFILAAVSATFFFAGGYPRILAAGVLAQVSSILDGCDGEIARLKFLRTRFGEHLDRFLDRYADALIIAGLTFASFQAVGSSWVWLAGICALTGSFMNSYTALSYDEMIRHRVSSGKAVVRVGRDLRLFIVFVGAVLNQLWLTLVVLAFLTNIESLRRLLVMRYAFRSS